MKNHLKKFMMLGMFLVFNVQSSEWSQLSLENYVDIRFECEKRIMDDNWSMTLWPVENSTSKPSRQLVFSDSQVKQKILSDLRMESALQKLIGIKITPEMLQADIDRMLMGSKDSEGLNRLFKLLGDDPRMITECLSRPYLVQEKMQNNYWLNDRFHRATFQTAKLALNQNMMSEDRTEKRTTVFINAQVDQTELEELKSTYGADPEVLELKGIAFKNALKNNRFNNKQLLEAYKSYTYSELLEEHDDYFVVQTLSWNKTGFDDWWQEEAHKWPLKNPINLQTDFTIRSELAQTKHLNGTNSLVDLWESPDIPTARYSHTAVWTGTEMLIWGGQDGGLNTATKTGSRYNPATDTWRAMSVSNAPLPRYKHTAVWTGSEMIIWGGLGEEHSADNLNSGSKYNPLLNSWQDISLDNVISPRNGHRAIWTGEEMIIWGGHSNEGGRYNPNTDQWQRTNIIGAPIFRSDPAVIWTGSKMIIWGGVWSHNELNSGGIYDPQSNSWSTINTDDAPSPRTNHAAVWTGVDMLVWGGDTDGAPLRNGKKYNPQSDSWTVINDEINPPYLYRFDSPGIWTGDKMLLWHGFQSGGGALYDPISDDWSLVSHDNEPEQRSGYSMVWTGDEMLVWGGAYFSRRKDSGGIYNPQTNSWVQMKTRHEPLGGSTLWTGTEMIVWGDSNDSVGEGGKYDPIQDRWSVLSKQNAPHERVDHELIWTGSEMIVWGGDTNNTIPNNGRYEPMSDTWVSLSTDNQPDDSREDFSAVWTGEQMVIWGGRYADDIGGLYNPHTDQWSTLSIVGAPSQRYLHSAIWTGTEMIIWGGYDGSDYLDDGAKYNPLKDQWLTLASDNAPKRRREHSAIWTGTEMIISEGDIDSFFKSSGRYNPSSDSWQIFGSDPELRDREGHVAFWTGEEMLMWGGVWSSGHGDTPGSIYNLSTNSWRPMNIENQPTTSGARNQSMGVWTGNNMYIWQNTENGTNLKTYRYSLPDLIFSTGFEGGL